MGRTRSRQRSFSSFAGVVQAEIQTWRKGETMTKRTITREIARAAAMDAGDRSMHQAERTTWSREDYNAMIGEFNRLWPEELDIMEVRQ